MAAKITDERYGKSRVRMVKVSRKGETHSLTDLTVHIALEGDFESAYTRGDNSKVLPTDTMKNTVYALGKSDPIETIESFALRLGRHFVGVGPQIARARVTIVRTMWDRIRTHGKHHPHSFTRSSDESPMCEAVVEKNGDAAMESGIDDMVVLKTTNSGFSGFFRDRFTTLKETDDRIFGTSVRARWRYDSARADFAAGRESVRSALLETFANHRSASVQQTLCAMGEAALEGCREMRSISLRMPNRHCLLVDLAPFGMTNENEIFLPIDEPSGMIEATMEREGRGEGAGQ